MPRLIVMRHAKAVDRMEAEDDFERGLTERGRADAARAAAAVKAAGFVPDHALVSPARRTRETYRIVSEALGETPVTDPMALYHASPDMLERAVMTALEGGAQSILMVGHNPGIGAFAHSLAAAAKATSGLPYGWPTSAAAGFEISVSDKTLTASERILFFNPKA